MNSARKQLYTEVLKTAVLALLLLTCVLIRAQADDSFFVMSVIQDFPMKQGDPVFRDYYVNAGSINGLREGIVLDAKRRLSAYDNINSKVAGDTSIKIAQLKVIHVDRDFSVARLVKMGDKEKTPTVGYDAVMIGDLISVAEKQ